MKFLKTSIIASGITVTITAVSAVPAFAHAGPHDASLFANTLHWLTSPTHALFAVVGSVVSVALIIKLKRSRS